MVFNFIRYFKDSVLLAWEDSLNNALNWSGIIGIGVMGAYYQTTGKKMVLGDDWISIVTVGLESAAVAWVVIFIFRLVFVSPYKLWKEAREKIDQMTPFKTSKEIRIKLGAFLEEGGNIIDACFNESDPAPIAKAEAWDATVSSYLREALDESYVNRFGNSSGIPMTTCSLHLPDHRNIYGQLYTRLARLQEFIAEFRE